MSDEQKKKFEKLRNNIPGLHIRNDGWCDEAMKAAYNLALEDAINMSEKMGKTITGHYPEAESYRIACTEISSNIDDLKIQ